MEDGNTEKPFHTCEGSLAPVKSVYATETRDGEESDDFVEMHGELEPCGQMNIAATRGSVGSGSEEEERRLSSR